MDISGDRMALDAARAAWLEDCRFRRLSAETLRAYQRVSARAVEFVTERLGRAARLDDLRSGLIRRWLTDRSPSLKPASVAAYVRAAAAGVGGLLRTGR